MTRSVLRAEDVLAIADVSTDETKKIRSDDLVLAALENLPDGTLEGSVIDWDSVPENSIDGSTIKDRSIEGVKLVLDTVTPLELQDDLPGTIIVNGGIDTAQLADGAVETSKIDTAAVTTDKIADLAVTDAKINDVNGSKLVDQSVDASKFDPGAFGGGLTVDGTPQVVHTNNVTPSSANGTVYDEHGHVTGSTPILSSELPSPLPPSLAQSASPLRVVSTSTVVVRSRTKTPSPLERLRASATTRTVISVLSTPAAKSQQQTYLSLVTPQRNSARFTSQFKNIYR